MRGLPLSRTLQIAFGAQAAFALALIFYVSQTLLRHLQFDVPQPIVDYLFQLLAILVPPAMLFLSFLALLTPRRAVQASVIAQLLVCAAAARLLVPELLGLARGENIGWAGRLLIAGSAPVMLVSLTLAAVFYYQRAATRETRSA